MNTDEVRPPDRIVRLTRTACGHTADARFWGLDDIDARIESARTASCWACLEANCYGWGLRQGLWKRNSRSLFKRVCEELVKRDNITPPPDIDALLDRSAPPLK